MTEHKGDKNFLKIKIYNLLKLIFSFRKMMLGGIQKRILQKLEKYSDKKLNAKFN